MVRDYRRRRRRPASRRLIGVPIADTVEPWCYEATRDNIRHYAHGIGDDNPLWCDPAYAADDALRRRSSPRRASCSPSTGSCPATSAGCPASTPCGPAPTSPGTSRSAGATEVRTTAHLNDLVEHQTSFAGRAFQQIYHVELFDADGALLCRRRLVVLPHRARHGPRARHEVRRSQGPSADALRRDDLERDLRPVRRRGASAAPNLAGSRTSRSATRSRRWPRAR